VTPSRCKRIKEGKALEEKEKVKENPKRYSYVIFEER